MTAIFSSPFSTSRAGLVWGLALAVGLSSAGCGMEDPQVHSTNAVRTYQRVVQATRHEKIGIPLVASAKDVDHRQLAKQTSVTAGVATDRLAYRGVSRTDVTNRHGARISHVSMRQSIDGVPVAGTYLNYTLHTDAAEVASKIVTTSYKLYEAPDVDTVATVTEEAAVARALTALRVTGGHGNIHAELTVTPLNGTLHLVWSVGVEGEPMAALILANGKAAGRAIVRDDRVHGDGHVYANVAHGGAPGGNGNLHHGPMPYQKIVTDPMGRVTHTWADGSYSLNNVPNGRGLVTGLQSRAATINDLSNHPVGALGQLGTNVDLVIEAHTEFELAQTTALFYLNRARAYLLDNGFDPKVLGAPVDTHVNNASVKCNAYYSFSSRTMVFGQSDAFCHNSAEDSVILHEYGHFLDHAHGGRLNVGLSEGWGDTLACYILSDPHIGRDNYRSGQGWRRCDNDYQYPSNGMDEQHNLGQAWAGFAWRVREGLIARYGAVEGDRIARGLVLPSLRSNAADIPAAVLEVFVRNDDDGDLMNKTPDWNVLYAAADHHALAFVVGAPDVTPPAAVTDLTVVSTTASTATLRWTATGDDGLVGRATSYVIHSSAAPIDEGNFDSLDIVSSPTPLTAGGIQELTVEIAPAATTYFALKVRDEMGLTSDLSNLVSADSQGVVLFEEDVESGAVGWVTEGLWHVITDGQIRGNGELRYAKADGWGYDTGAANAGTLLSPVIDLAQANDPVLRFDEFAAVETDPTRDLLTTTVFDVNNPSISVTLHKQDLASWETFATRRVSLAGLAGREVQIRFHFDTVDALNNDGAGWSIDNIQIIGNPTANVPSLVINEVLADPPPGYDANGDGVASTTEDEFVELYNAGDSAIELSEATFEDAIGVRHTFAASTVLEPGARLVLFGGGTPQLPGIATVATTGLRLNNSGDTIRVRRRDGEVLAEMSYGTQFKDQSWVRETDGSATAPFVGHRELLDQPASPGTGHGAPPDGVTPDPVQAQLVINEVLANPGGDYDANGDGHVDPREDEFVELLNVGSGPLDLSLAVIADAYGPRVSLPVGTILQPGEALVVFGGGDPAPIAGATVLALGPLQLNNSGEERISVRDASGVELAATDTFRATRGVSVVRAVEGDGDAELVLHNSVSTQVASPGRRADGAAF
ncbi:MAG: hypothetical protein ACI9MC_001220 [Kiritimatiellia bacterium]|jgi:hypothetical protein